MDPGYSVTHEELVEYNLYIIGLIYEECINNGFEYNGHTFSSSIEATTLINLAAFQSKLLLENSLDLPSSFSYPDIDMVEVPLDAAGAISLSQALFGLRLDCLETRELHRTNVLAFTEEEDEDLLAYDVTTLWPNYTA